MKLNNIRITRLSSVLVFVLMISTTAIAAKKQKLVILHTNDTHSQAEPSDLTAKIADMGGYARRMGVINEIRKQEKNVILLDAGDFSQGTPYFNFFNGRVEIEAMNRMQYDAGTLGNHELDNGVDTLAAVLRNARFQVVSSNYNVENTPLKGLIKPYTIIERSGIKIGIMGLNVQPAGLIIENNYKGIIYEDPIDAALKVSEYLKVNQKCQVVICLSHLGYTGESVTDKDIAKNTQYIDVVIGGHSHTLTQDNTTEINLAGKPVIISQMGKSGFYIGRIDITLAK